MDFGDLVLLFVGAALINNFILSRFLGICAFLGVSNRLSTALGMGAAVVFVMTISGTLSWAIQNYILEPFNLPFLQNLIFILVIATLVQFLEMVIRRYSPALYEAFGIYLPLITTNCAILGVALLVAGSDYGLLETVVFAIGSGIGWTLAIVLMAGLREELEFADVPPSLQGSALSLLIAAIMSLTFIGFSGVVPAL
ncbi:MAG: RnfABCDGE type electron transport complex subunit A [Limnochordales bacterium]|nr:RnfABCDGE type electron transport complex subunit A [Limnochordales bacterium]